MSVLKVLSILLLMAAGATGGAAMGGAFSSKKSSSEGGDGSLSSSGGSGASSVSSGGASSSSTVVAAAPITYKFLAPEITSDTTNYTATKIGKKYQNYLVGVYGTSDDNQGWWNDVHKTRYLEDIKDNTKKTALSPEFVDTLVVKGFAGKTVTAETEVKALNKACEKLYKKETSVLSTDQTNKDKYKNDLWRYCSELGGKPKFISDTTEEVNQYPDISTTSGSSTTTANSIGKEKKDVLLSTKQEINNKLWVWKQKEFFSKTTTEVTEKHFKDLLDNKTTKETVQYSLRDTCEEAYKKKTGDTTDDAEKVKPDTVVKYCSLDGVVAAGTPT